MKLLPTCRRCDGRGGLIIKLGEPGQDFRTGGPIRWEEPVSVRCPVCKGQGVEAKPPRKPRVGKFVIVETQKDRDQFENETAYLIARWRLSPKTVGGEKF